MLHQGYFKPKNPQKYKGDPTNIIYRSGWELKFMLYVDSHPEILEICDLNARSKERLAEL